MQEIKATWKIFRSLVNPLFPFKVEIPTVDWWNAYLKMWN